MSVDEALGLVYAPMGSPPNDFWGGARTPEVDKYSASIVALDLATGAPRWYFQTTHHDVWDYDVSAQPALVDWQWGVERVPALIQPTKTGQIFVLDRRDGKSCRSSPRDWEDLRNLLFQDKRPTHLIHFLREICLSVIVANVTVPSHQMRGFKEARSCERVVLVKSIDLLARTGFYDHEAAEVLSAVIISAHRSGLYDLDGSKKLWC